MHPTDLSAHRAQRHRQQVRALERDAARLMPRLDPDSRLHIRDLCDSARNGEQPVADAHALIRDTISRLDRGQHVELDRAA